jgi:molybdopterin synthase sulfur carrier subunit
MLNLKEIRVDCEGVQTIDNLLEQVEEIVFEKTAKKFLWKLIEEGETIRRGTIILINGRNILDSNGLNCQVKSGDTVALFPPGGGG